jgi:hypothetical protein
MAESLAMNYSEKFEEVIEQRFRLVKSQREVQLLGPNQ